MTEVQSLAQITRQQTAVSPEVLEEIFGGYTQADPDVSLAEIFTPESAELYLARVGNAAQLLSEEDSHAEALRKLDEEIARLEGVRDQVLAKLYEEIRPLERSYRLLHLFFANSEVPGVRTQAPVFLHVVNADAAAVRNPTESPTLRELKKYIRQKNDSFNFREAISNLVVPGYVPDPVRKELEELAHTYGMLLIGDLRDEKSFDRLIANFSPNGGIYQALKRQQDQATSDVVMAGYVRLRDRHWFEGADDGVYAPSSMLFAGAIVRSDRTPGAGISQGPVGMRHGKVKGVEKVRFEPLVSETEELTMNRQLVTIIRNADNDFCFIGNRSLADDTGTMKFFTTQRVFRFIERMIANYARQVVGQALTRKVVDEQVEEPIRAFLNELKKNGAIQEVTDVDIDKTQESLSQGIVNIDIKIKPVGPAETFNISIRESRTPTAAAAR